MDILKYIESYGYKAYYIGGYPRDKYLGIETFDYDICTNATPDELNAILECNMRNSNFGSVIATYNNKTYEITTFRIDGKYKHNRIPDKIEFVSDLEIDLKRRDFVINTLALDSNGNYVDLLGAIKDIDNKIIRTVGNSDERIEEDAIRILRAIRFEADLEFELDANLKNSIIKYKHLLNNLSDYQIFKELNKIKNKERAKALFIKYEIDVQ